MSQHRAQATLPVLEHAPAACGQKRLTPCGARAGVAARADNREMLETSKLLGSPRKGRRPPHKSFANLTNNLQGDQQGLPGKHTVTVEPINTK